MIGFRVLDNLLSINDIDRDGFVWTGLNTCRCFAVRQSIAAHIAFANDALVCVVLGNIIRTGQRAVLTTEALVIQMPDNAGDRVLLVRIHGTSGHAGWFETMMAGRSDVLHGRIGRSAAEQQSNVAPGFVLIKSVQRMTCGDACLAPTTTIQIHIERVLLTGARRRRRQQLRVVAGLIGNCHRRHDLVKTDRQRSIPVVRAAAVSISVGPPCGRREHCSGPVTRFCLSDRCCVVPEDGFRDSGMIRRQLTATTVSCGTLVFAGSRQMTADFCGEQSVKHLNLRQIEIHNVVFDFHRKDANGVIFVTCALAIFQTECLLMQRAGNLGNTFGITNDPPRQNKGFAMRTHLLTGIPLTAAHKVEHSNLDPTVLDRRTTIRLESQTSAPPVPSGFRTSSGFFLTSNIKRLTLSQMKRIPSASRQVVADHAG